MVHGRTLPDRLALFATLHGLSPPPISTARVLEIGCADGLNSMAFAAAYPDSRFEAFDLSTSQIASGRDLLAASTLTNIALNVRDLVGATGDLPAQGFDYIIAHGVYAWVPETVRGALMEVIAHTLSPNGVAFISYNAMPGGYFRMALRDMLLHEIGDIADPEERLIGARTFLEELAADEAPGTAAAQFMGHLAELILEYDIRALFHDELNEDFAPQSLTDVVTAAERAGLRYLSDTEQGRCMDGFLKPGEDETDDVDRILLRRAQSGDYRETCLFRTSLFVRGDARPSRVFSLNRFERLWVSTRSVYDEANGRFTLDGTKHLKFEDPDLKAMFRRIVDANPGRVALVNLVSDRQRWKVFLQLFCAGHIEFHTAAAPFAATVGDRPETSPLVRAEIAKGREKLTRLDHRLLAIPQGNLRALLAAADGRHTVPEIAAMLDGIFPADEIVPALNSACDLALMRG